MVVASGVSASGFGVVVGVGVVIGDWVGTEAVGVGVVIGDRVGAEAVVGVVDIHVPFYYACHVLPYLCYVYCVVDSVIVCTFCVYACAFWGVSH